MTKKGLRVLIQEYVGGFFTQTQKHMLIATGFFTQTQKHMLIATELPSRNQVARRCWARLVKQ